MLHIWWSPDFSAVSRTPEHLQEKLVIESLGKFGSYDIFYKMLTADDLSYFLSTFYKNKEKWNLKYNLRQVYLKNPYKGGCHLVDNLAKFAVEKYNADHESIHFKSVMRVFSFEYTGGSMPDSLLAAYFITLQAKDKDGALNVYHANVLTTNGLENLLLDFHLDFFSSGQSWEEQKFHPWMHDLTWKQKIYEERLLLSREFDMHKKNVQLCKIPNGAEEKSVLQVSTPKGFDVACNVGRSNEEKASLNPSSSGKRLKRKRVHRDRILFGASSIIT